MSTSCQLSADIRREECTSSDNSSTSSGRRGSSITTDSKHCSDGVQLDDNNNIDRSSNATKWSVMSIDNYCCYGTGSMSGSSRCKNYSTTTSSSSPTSTQNHNSRLRGRTFTLNSNTYCSNNITALEAYNRGMLFTYLISKISNHLLDCGDGSGSCHCYEEYHDLSCSSCCSIFGRQQHNNNYNNNDDDPTIPTTKTSDLEIKLKKERLERRWSGHQPLVPDTWSSSSCDDNNNNMMSPLELRNWKLRRKRSVLSSSSSSSSNNSQLPPLLSPVEEIRLAASSFANIRCYPSLLLDGGSVCMEQKSPLPSEKHPSVPLPSPKWTDVARSALLSPTTNSQKNSGNSSSMVSSTTTRDALPQMTATSHSPPTLSSSRFPIQEFWETTRRGGGGS